MRSDVPETNPYAVWGMFVVVAIIVILFVLAYILWQ